MRLLIVDDHEVVRRGVRSLLEAENGLHVCGEAVDGQDAIAKAQQLEPDAIVIDISMPNMSGLDAIREIRRLLPRVRIVVLSQHDDPAMMRQALTAGAHGYVVKSAITADLLNVLQRVWDGEQFVLPAALGSTGTTVDAQELLRELEASKEQVAQESTALRKLNECSSRLWKIASLHEGLEEMLSAIIELLRADKGNVQLLSAECGVLTIEAQRGFEKDFLDFFREVSADDDSACGRALRTGERIVIRDVDEDASYEPFREVARAAGYRAVTSTPLIGRRGAPLGILSTHFRLPYRPSDHDLRRLDLYARQATDFIERCRIEEGLRTNEERLRTLSQALDLEVRARTKELEDKNADLLRQSEQVRELSHILLRTQDEERRYIARELHDSAGQTLAVLGMNVARFAREAQSAAPGIVERGKEIADLVQQLSREIRTTSYLLHPPLLDESGLSSALKEYVQGLTERSGIAITVDVDEGLGRLPRDMELAIFRLVQECLTNIHRHSGSTTARIRVFLDGGSVRVEVTDQGKGIPPQRLTEIQTGASGVGIRGMRERLRHLGGTLNIESNSSGTRVSATIPVRPEAAASMRVCVNLAAQTQLSDKLRT
jgi:signal transduction histidine kinase